MLHRLRSNVKRYFHIAGDGECGFLPACRASTIEGDPYMRQGQRMNLPSEPDTRSWSEIYARSELRSDEWYLLRAMGHAATVCEALERHFDGATTYFPVAKVKRVVRHLEQVAERPVFTGYVYAKFNRYPDWRHMQEYCGALCIMRQEVDGVLRPLRERDSIVQQIKDREARGEFNEDEKNPTLDKLIGSAVKIPCSAFIGQIGKVHSIEEGIVKVRLWFMGKRQFLSFKFDDLFTESGEMK